MAHPTDSQSLMRPWTHWYTENDTRLYLSAVLIDSVPLAIPADSRLLHETLGSAKDAADT